jgi:pimeloyl-ACP methyl ester carboxylesterase
VVLVGHSYGGVVITAAGDHPTVARLVYIAAMAPDEGESAASMAADDPETQAIAHTFPLSDVLTFDNAGNVIFPPEHAQHFFYGDCDAEAAAWAAAQLLPQGGACFADVMGAPAWRHKPSIYVRCTDDRAVHPDLQRILARRCTTTVEWPTSHSPFLSQPHLVAELLSATARAHA